MSVPSFPFLCFAIVAAILVNLSQKPTWREPGMLVANLCFLASFSNSPLAFAPLALFIAGSYALLEVMRRWPQQAFWFAIIVALCAFFWLKKYSFVPAALFLRTPYVAVGVSYITFRILHLLIDTGQGVMKQRIRVIDYLNYVICFPCIVAGPIQMYPDYEAGKTGRPDLARIGGALERITLGMFKVFIVSAVLDYFHTQAVTDVLAGDGALTKVLPVVAIYPIYLYFNFSGYTDVVIGAGHLMGLTLPENFDHPFGAPNFIDFWSRWHITLSTWLRTYVYSPLMMSLMRRAPAPSLAPAFTVFAFFVTFFLVGAWHGQTSEFLFFGVLQGGGVAMNKLYQITMTERLGRKGYRQLSDHPLYVALARGLTFTWFAFTLLWFWSNWSDLGRMWRAMGPATAIESVALLWLVATVALELLARAAALFGNMPNLTSICASPYARTVSMATMAFFTVLTVYVLAAPPPAIVYKAF